MISVIMPVFNGERFLVEAIKSVLNQTLADFELILINDGSSDNTLSIMLHFSEIDSRIIIIDRENRGLVESLNEGIELARGRFIARMDADDICLPNRFLRQIEYFRDFPNIAVLGSRTVVIDESGKVVGRCRRPLTHQHIVTYFLYGSPLAHPSVMFNMDMLDKSHLQYRASAYPAEDLDLWLRLSMRYKLANLKVPLIKYRMNVDGISGNNSELQTDRSYEIRRDFFQDDEFPYRLVEVVHTYAYRPNILGLVSVALAAILNRRVESPIYLLSVLVRLFSRRVRLIKRTRF
jgi:glycosyltransferase involved in cell wall biosynthesis